MVVLDTCAIICDALTPRKLSKKAQRIINQSDKDKRLLCSDISSWEIAMLIVKKRLDPGTDYHSFITAVFAARHIQVQPISPEIAHLAVTFPKAVNNDPADRIILATAITNKATLITCDSNLIATKLVSTVW